MIDTCTFAYLEYNEACTRVLNFMLIRDTVFSALLMYNMKSTVARMFVSNNTNMFKNTYTNHSDLINIETWNTLQVKWNPSFVSKLHFKLVSIFFYLHFTDNSNAMLENAMNNSSSDCVTKKTETCLFWSYYIRTFSSVNNHLYDIYLHPFARMLSNVK